MLDRDDLIECSVLLKSAIEKKIDKIHIPLNPLDVLAQQIFGIAISSQIHKDDLFNLIRAGFSKRRKTLLNALLSEGYKELSKEQLEKALKDAGIPDNARAETLYLSDFARIVNSIEYPST